MFETLLSSLADGLSLGFVYGLAAMGLTLIWGVMNVINLSHGPVMALGMFGIYLTFTKFGLNPYLALLVVGVVGLILGMIIYIIAVHRVIDAPHLSTLLATFSVSMIIIGIGTSVLTTTPRNIDFTLGSLRLGPIVLPMTRLAAVFAALAVTLLLYLFLQRTRQGKYIRAVSDNRGAAELMGINSTKILALSFGIGTLLAAVPGGLIATFFPFTILSGTNYELKSFIIGVLGGLGNPLGALVAGLILGVIEATIPLLMPTTWVPLIEFVLFIAILLYKPNGLFGSES